MGPRHLLDQPGHPDADPRPARPERRPAHGPHRHPAHGARGVLRGGGVRHGHPRGAPPSGLLGVGGGRRPRRRAARRRLRPCRAHERRVLHPADPGPRAHRVGRGHAVDHLHGRRERREQCPAAGRRRRALRRSVHLLLSGARGGGRVRSGLPPARALAVRSVPARHPREREPHARPRLQRVRAQVRGVRHLRRARRRGGCPLRVLEPLRVAGGGDVPRLGGGGADGHPRRHRHDPGAVHRRRDHPRHPQLGQRLRRLVDGGDGPGVHRHRIMGAARPARARARDARAVRRPAGAGAARGGSGPDLRGGHLRDDGGRQAGGTHGSPPR